MFTNIKPIGNESFKSDVIFPILIGYVLYIKE